MCLAPRYISGPMARPSSDCRNSASLPATPCAHASGAMPITNAAAMAREILRATLILPVAVVAGVVEPLAEVEHLVFVLRFRRAQDVGADLDHFSRDRRPVSGINRARSHQHQIA